MNQRARVAGDRLLPPAIRRVYARPRAGDRHGCLGPSSYDRRVTLADEYRRQYAWRSWERVFDALPTLQGQRIVDLGCGPGDQAQDFVTRGASVIGIDMNAEILGVARSRNLPAARFVVADLKSLPVRGEPCDGIWASFSAAYFVDFPQVLSTWLQVLKPGGWIAITEIDDLFNHEPLAEPVKTLLKAYADDALAQGRYDFRMGHKVPGYLASAGLRVASPFTLPDAELSFAGAAAAGVLEAWELRLARMKLLQMFCGPSFELVRSAFLACLASTRHASHAKVCCCIAVKEQ